MHQDKEKAPAGQSEGNDTRKVNQMSDNIIPIGLDLSAVPEREEDAHWADGYVYIIEYSNRTIKVGLSANLRRRVGNHISRGRKLGTRVTRGWFSPVHRGYQETERRLIRFASNSGELQGGNEYFHSLDFKTVVEYAESLNLEASTSEQIDCDRESREMAQAAREGMFERVFGSIDKRPEVRVDGWRIQFVLSTFFDELEELPALGGDADAEIVQQVKESIKHGAPRMGVNVDEVDDWSAIEVLEHLLDLTVESAKLGLRIRAHEESRADLFEPYFTGVAS